VYGRHGFGGAQRDSARRLRCVAFEPAGELVVRRSNGKSELVTLLRELVRAQTSNTWLVAAVALVGAAIGAYFSSYLRKRGEDRAINETSTKFDNN
jgi:hypothetical protein